MIIVRFAETFRERMPEWVQAVGMILWGILTLSTPGLFQAQEFYHPLLLLFSQWNWGLIATVIGFIRLVFLVINGSWRPSAHIRAIGCVFGSLLWGSLLISALSLSWLTSGLALYVMLLALDLFSLWFSAGDAKLADLRAKDTKRVV